MKLWEWSGSSWTAEEDNDTPPNTTLTASNVDEYDGKYILFCDQGNNLDSTRYFSIDAVRVKTSAGHFDPTTMNVCGN